MEVNRSNDSNNLFLLINTEDKIEQELSKILVDSYTKNKKICHICISKTYYQAKENADKLKIDDLTFIDLLSSHYKKKEDNDKNCIFISAPYKLDELKEKIFELKNSCDLFIFDTICSLLKYNKPDEIIFFINSLVQTIHNKEKIFLANSNCDSIPGNDEKEEMLKDMLMFIDKYYEK